MMQRKFTDGKLSRLHVYFLNFGRFLQIKEACWIDGVRETKTSFWDGIV